MTNEPQNPSPIQDEEPKNRLKRFETWLLSFSWAIGAAIYGWLIAGVIYKREYPNLTWDKLGGADWWFTGVSGGLTLLVCLVYFFFRSKKGAG